jgi:TonB family protein
MRRLSFVILLLLLPLIARGQEPYPVGGDVKAPVVIVRVEPVYPEEARLERITGVVILGTRIDRNGVVTDIKVLKGLPNGLTEAAVDAVKRWVFKPATMNGQAVDVIFNLTVNFQLVKTPDPEAAAKTDAEAEGPLHVGGDVKAPEVLKHVNPQYPELARRNKVSGVVVMEAVIDHTGALKNLKVIQPLPDGLSEAAVDAVKQWTFAPGTMNGKPVDVVFNLTINFKL